MNSRLKHNPFVSSLENTYPENLPKIKKDFISEKKITIKTQINLQLPLSAILKNFQNDLWLIFSAQNSTEIKQKIAELTLKWSQAQKIIFYCPILENSFKLKVKDSKKKNNFEYQKILHSKGQQLAQIKLFFADKPKYNYEQLQILANLSRFSSQALFTAHQFKNAYYLANHDPLTTLFNRRTFDITLKTEYQRAKRYNLTLSLLIIDIDHFKKVNDQYGHQAGDYCLKVLGNIIKNNCRSSDIGARIGGEEFAILMPKTNTEQAFYLAKRIAWQLKQNVIEYKSQQIKFTISQGIVENNFFWVSSDDNLLYWGDRALYLAKDQGRNQICLATELIDKQNKIKDFYHALQRY